MWQYTDENFSTDLNISLVYFKKVKGGDLIQLQNSCWAREWSGREWGSREEDSTAAEGGREGKEEMGPLEGRGGTLRRASLVSLLLQARTDNEGTLGLKMKACLTHSMLLVQPFPISCQAVVGGRKTQTKNSIWYSYSISLLLPGWWRSHTPEGEKEGRKW